RDRSSVTLGLALPVVGDLVAVACLDMPVDAVEADVQLAADVPLRVRQVPLEELAERLEPRNAIAPFGLPELLPVTLVDVGRRIRLCCEVLGRRIPPLLEEHRVDGVLRPLGCHSLSLRSARH